MINSKEEAQAKINEVCKWLDNLDTELQRANPNRGESKAASIARGFCHDLLADAGADGVGGCPLCQG